MSKLKLLLLGLGNIGAGVTVMLFVAFFLHRKGQQMNMRMLIFLAVGAGFIAFLVMQFMPLIFSEVQVTNPEVTYSVQWNSPEAEALWNRTCNDCHSNTTIWPWYSYVAPVSWLVTSDVYRGRDHLNISEEHNFESEDLIESINRGRMPPIQYVLNHPGANLNDAEKAQLVEGLRITFGGSETDQHDD